jgi:hypothetical protein
MTALCRTLAHGAADRGESVAGQPTDQAYCSAQFSGLQPENPHVSTSRNPQRQIAARVRNASRWERSDSPGTNQCNAVSPTVHHAVSLPYEFV